MRELFHGNVGKVDVDERLKLPPNYFDSIPGEQVSLKLGSITSPLTIYDRRIKAVKSYASFQNHHYRVKDEGIAFLLDFFSSSSVLIEEGNGLLKVRLGDVIADLPNYPSLTLGAQKNNENLNDLIFSVPYQAGWVLFAMIS